MSSVAFGVGLLAQGLCLGGLLYGIMNMILFWRCSYCKCDAALDEAVRETIIVVDASAAIVKGSRCSHTLQDTIRNPLRERERERKERERERKERERERETERERESESERERVSTLAKGWGVGTFVIVEKSVLFAVLNHHTGDQYLHFESR